MPNLTDADLAAMEARCEAATEGPWDWYFSDYERGTWVILPVVGTPRYVKDSDAPCICDDVQTKPNATFIAHSRTDLPALIAELRAAREEAERLRNKLARAEAYRHVEDADEITALRARVAELEAERDALRAEGVAMREACLVACNTCREFPDADREHFIPRYPSCVEEGCIVYQALSAPLTAAEVERVKALEAVERAAREQPPIEDGMVMWFKWVRGVKAALANPALEGEG